MRLVGSRFRVTDRVLKAQATVVTAVIKSSMLIDWFAGGHNMKQIVAAAAIAVFSYRRAHAPLTESTGV